MLTVNVNSMRNSFQLLINRPKMQGMACVARSCREILKLAALQHSPLRDTVQMKNVLSRLGCVTSSSTMQQKGLENTTVSEVLMTKGEEKTGSWLWCHTDDPVHDAVKHVSIQNILAISQYKSTYQ